jgi:glycosyltransferase involved in cell wall biosynthesis
MPLVSIVLPVYNGSRFLRESIQSVLEQSLQDFELLICDDASTDDSRDIIASYHDARIRFITNSRNLGLFPTLNRLVDESQCELIRLWSQDDRMAPNCLAVEVEFGDRHPELGMFYCGWEIIDESGAVIGRLPPHDTPEVIEPWLANQISYYYGCMPGNIATVSLRRSAFGRVGPFGQFRIAGDFEMWSRITNHYPIGCIPRHLIQLRSHAGQLSRWKESNVSCMRESECVYDRLALWFPDELQDHIRRYRHRNVYVQYFHHGIRAALAMEWSVARRTFVFLMGVSNPLRVGWWWLISGNRRWFRMRTTCRMPAAPPAGALAFCDVQRPHDVHC